MALGLAEYGRPADVVEEPPPPVGAIIATVFAALLAGSAVSTLGAGTGLAAWAGAAAIGVSLAVSTRMLFSGSVTRTRLLAWLALAAGLVAYLLPLSFESLPRTRHFSLLLAMTLLAMAFACAAPVAIILISTGRRIPVPRDSFAPIFISGALGACSVVVWLIALFWTGAATAGWSQAGSLTAVLVVAVAMPVVCVVPWAYAYDWIVSRWAIALPPKLTQALDVLASRTNFRFDRIVCLPAAYGAGSVCEVIRRASGSTLAISESIVEKLEPEPLVAVLAHEAAHIQRHHLRRKMVCISLGSVALIGSSIVVQLWLAPRVPRSLEFALGILPVILIGNLLSQLYRNRVTRRHETEADAAAVAASSADALCEALEVLGGGGPSERWVHPRWTTHGTREGRLARIRAVNPGQSG